eukprot:2708768-Prymnesium_polylepis.1
MDDYDQRFPQGLAEACVADLLRARAVLDSGEAMTRLQEMLQEGISVEVDESGSSARAVDQGGQVAQIQLVRSKPKMALEALDPMRKLAPKSRHRAVG